MDNLPKDLQGEKPFRVRRGRVDSVDLYEIKESELDLLERGSPVDLQLNFAIFLVSTAFAAFCSLATATFADQRIETTFILVVVVGVAMGGFLILSWYRNRTSTRQVCKAIRGRIPADVTPIDPTSPDPQTSPAKQGDPDQPSG